MITDTTNELFIKMALSLWQQQNKRVDDLMEQLPEAALMNETATGRNTGIYLLGHLAAVNDGLFKILGVGERLHPELDAVFLTAPDKSGQQMPSVATLKTYWKEINEALIKQFESMNADDWFSRHMSVSEADFAKEPHRNKLNVLMNRTVHQGYHLGQMNYLKTKVID